MTPTPTKLHTATVKILRVEESRTRATWERPEGRRRFLIQAEMTTGASSGERLISLTTLDAWKASLCLDVSFGFNEDGTPQGRHPGGWLCIKYKLTRFFDAALLSVETVKREVTA